MHAKCLVSELVCQRNILLPSLASLHLCSTLNNDGDQLSVDTEMQSTVVVVKVDVAKRCNGRSKSSVDFAAAGQLDGRR